MPKLPWWEVAARLSELVDAAADHDQETIIEKDGEDKAILMSMKRKLGNDATVDILSSPSRCARLAEADTAIVDYDATDLWREMYGTEPPWQADVPAQSGPPAAPSSPAMTVDLQVDMNFTPEELSSALERANREARAGRAEGMVRGPVVPARNPNAPWVFETTDVPEGWHRDADHIPAPIYHDLRNLTRDYLHCRSLWTEIETGANTVKGWRRRKPVTPQTLITFCAALYSRGETLESRLRTTSSPEQSLRTIEMMIDLTYIWYTLMRRDPVSPRRSIIGVERLHDRCVISLREIMRRYRLTNHAPEHLLVTRTSPSPVAPARPRRRSEAVRASEPAAVWQRDSHG